MAQITAAMVKQLREMTDSPMMECKKALVEADGDIDKAVDVLRTMGIAKAVKKAGRDTNEGTVGTFVSEDGRIGAMVEVSCETDFVGTNPKFTGFAAEVAQAVANNDPADIDALKASSFAGDETVDAALTEMIHVMGENMKIARFTRIQVENGAVASYVHGGKIGVLVEFGFEKPETASNETFKNFAHDVALQVAAAAPVAARREDVPAETVEHEMAIYKKQAADSGKPEHIQQKMAEGRLEKFMKENVLTDQVFIKDSDTTISKLMAKVSKECGDTIVILSFQRFVCGD
jgi:elongation factor Ts